MEYEIDLISFPHGEPRIQTVNLAATNIRDAWRKGYNLAARFNKAVESKNQAALYDVQAVRKEAGIAL